MERLFFVTFFAVASIVTIGSSARCEDEPVLQYALNIETGKDNVQIHFGDSLFDIEQKLGKAAKSYLDTKYEPPGVRKVMEYNFSTPSWWSGASKNNLVLRFDKDKLAIVEFGGYETDPYEGEIYLNTVDRYALKEPFKMSMHPDSLAQILMDNKVHLNTEFTYCDVDTSVIGANIKVGNKLDSGHKVQAVSYSFFYAYNWGFKFFGRYVLAVNISVQEYVIDYRTRLHYR